MKYTLWIYDDYEGYHQEVLNSSEEVAARIEDYRAGPLPKPWDDIAITPGAPIQGELLKECLDKWKAEWEAHRESAVGS
jgi:hypothetical protein